MGLKRGIDGFGGLLGICTCGRDVGDRELEWGVLIVWRVCILSRRDGFVTTAWVAPREDEEVSSESEMRE